MLKFKRFSALIMVIVMAVGLISCGGKSLEDQLAGPWYLNGQPSQGRDGNKVPAFTLYDDGTCKIASEYGTGTWAVVNGNQLKITNFYGESHTAIIESIDNGRLTLDQGVYWNTLK